MNNLFISIWFTLVCCTYGYIFHNFTLGRIKGRTLLSRDRNKFYAFLGLPYAEPPIDDLRFQNPVLYTEAWQHTYDATVQREICPQIKSIKHGYAGNEDCLYLNLYTPQSPQNITRKLPVWFFIYPGRRLFGAPSLEQYGPHYFMDHPVIFVIASYRMGALGFLSTEDDVIKGNFGLKDQSMVLRWINRYIAEFGGDPNNVAISGQSSGAIDVWLHIFSPLSANLFHKAIVQSGCALNYRAIPEPGNALRQTWKFANLLGCAHSTIKSNDDLKHCLMQVPPEVLTGATGLLMHDYMLPHTFFGVVIEAEDSDGAFLVSHPIIDIRKPNNITILIGVVPDEGQQKVMAMYSFPDKNLQDNVKQHFFSNYYRLYPYMFSFDYSPNSSEILDVIMDRYCSNEPLKNTYNCVSKIAGFSTVHLGMMESARMYPGRTFYYYYEHANEIGYKKVYEQGFGLSSEYKYGTVHGEELRSLFYQEIFFPPTLKGVDRIVSEQVVELFVNFITYGDPNGEQEEKILKPVSTPDFEYIHINNLTVTSKIRPLWDEYLFFKRLNNPPLMTLERLNQQYDENPLFPQHRKLKEKLSKYLHGAGVT